MSDQNGTRVAAPRDLRDALSDHLDEIATYFKGEPLMTLVVRNPSLNDADIVLSNDDNLEAIIERLRKYEVDNG